MWRGHDSLKRTIFVVGAIAIFNECACTKSPDGSPTLPPKVVLENPAKNDVRDPSDQIVFKERVIVQNGGWVPRAVVAKLAEKKNQKAMHGSVASQEIVEEDPGSFWFGLELPAPDDEGDYVAWVRVDGSAEMAGGKSENVRIESERVEVKVRKPKRGAKR